MAQRVAASRSPDRAATGRARGPVGHAVLESERGAGSSRRHHGLHGHRRPPSCRPEPKRDGRDQPHAAQRRRGAPIRAGRGRHTADRQLPVHLGRGRLRAPGAGARHRRTRTLPAQPGFEAAGRNAPALERGTSGCEGADAAADRRADSAGRSAGGETTCALADAETGRRLIGASGSPRGLASDTDVLYSTGSFQENTMHRTALRYHYRPPVNHVPDWMRRVWAWF